MRTALVYHEDMTAPRLLWEDPECEIECPERLTTAMGLLQQRGLEQRCLRLAAREASEAELGLVHSPEYVVLLRGTQALGTEELQALSGQYDAVYFHPSTFHSARLAVGAGLQLVDAVLTGAVHNGLALVRPPGHHSQRAAANGFCVFNNVAIAAKHAQQKHGLHRILIVDWDIHHGQGTQYIFEDDPSVLYFSWHRYEHGRFWPYLQESDAVAVGQGQGRGFTVNLPWNQVGMGNADYMAAFLHVLLPLAFEFDPELVLVSAGFDSAIGDPEGQMQATPECFAHLTQLLQVLASGRVCAMLEGGYNLESLSESVCMTVQALLGDPAPPLSGPMVPHCSALESIQSVRAAQVPHWTSLQQQDLTPVLSPSTCTPEGRPSPLLSGGPEFKVAAAQATAALSALLDQMHLRRTPPVRTAVSLTGLDAALALPSDILHQEGSALKEETQAWARLHEALAKDEPVSALGKESSSVAATRAPAAAATLDMAIRCSLSRGAQRLLCVAVGQLDRPPDLTDDGYAPCVMCPSSPASLWVPRRNGWVGQRGPGNNARRVSSTEGQHFQHPYPQTLPHLPTLEGEWAVTHTHVSMGPLSLKRRTLWLNIRGKEAAALSMFHVSMPLPGTTGGFLNYLLALVLPLAYGFQPDLVLLALGPAHGLRDPQAALLAALLRAPAGCRVLALVDEESTPQLAGVLAQVLHGEAPPCLGPFCVASPEDMQALMHLRGQLEPQWKLLQVAGETGNKAPADCLGPWGTALLQSSEGRGAHVLGLGCCPEPVHSRATRIVRLFPAPTSLPGPGGLKSARVGVFTPQK
ncbi:PREDICTED: histone deacetylase 10 isoform X2 [Miniopterus natalensis]|uniref:histone deacetylase 10 isoform X2 n=1 Tax=Miniopterus natalensis TaxID=291302 RepID=UPI0007A7104C|nr:PREDICTED: histone deacetylase 10 isoform X2 [Miniopterus natalensis]